jgi:hypothetical protein
MGAKWLASYKARSAKQLQFRNGDISMNSRLTTAAYALTFGALLGACITSGRNFDSANRFRISVDAKTPRSSEDEVRALLGEPFEVAEAKPNSFGGTTEWHYGYGQPGQAKNLWVFFDKERRAVGIGYTCARDNGPCVGDDLATLPLSNGASENQAKR